MREKEFNKKGPKKKKERKGKSAEKGVGAYVLVYLHDTKSEKKHHFLLKIFRLKGREKETVLKEKQQKMYPYIG